MATGARVSGGAGSGATQRVIVGDCVRVMSGMEAGSFDAIVCDPPYNLSFMNKEFDRIGSPVDFERWTERWAREALRVTRPGGVLMAFGSPRTAHRLTCGIEDAGWFVFDKVMHIHAQGFPKHKSLLKPAYEEVVVAKKPGAGGLRTEAGRLSGGKDVPASPTGSRHLYNGGWRDQNGDKDVTNTSGWDRNTGRWPPNVAISHLPDRDCPTCEGDGLVIVGWNPDAYENIEGTCPDCQGTKLLPGCVPVGVRRVKGNDRPNVAGVLAEREFGYSGGGRAVKKSVVPHADPDGRETVPAYRCAPGCAVAELDRQSGTSTSRKGSPRAARSSGDGWGDSMRFTGAEYDDAGGASRFVKTCAWEPGEARFRYVPKADRAERDRGLDGMPLAEGGSLKAGGNHVDSRVGRVRSDGYVQHSGAPAHRNTHPCVKPLDLVQWLVRMACPPGGTLLDPFLGSGTTLIACDREGVNGVGIELSEEYARIAELRIRGDAPLFARVITG